MPNTNLNCLDSPFFRQSCRLSLHRHHPKHECKQIAREISKVIIVNYKMCKILPRITVGISLDSDYDDVCVVRCVGANCKNQLAFVVSRDFGAIKI